MDRIIHCRRSSSSSGVFRLVCLYYMRIEEHANLFHLTFLFLSIRSTIDAHFWNGRTDDEEVLPSAATNQDNNCRCY